MKLEKVSELPNHETIFNSDVVESSSNIANESGALLAINGTVIGSYLTKHPYLPANETSLIPPKNVFRNTPWPEYRVVYPGKGP